MRRRRYALRGLDIPVQAQFVGGDADAAVPPKTSYFADNSR
ncbi:MAG: hypothetical protein ACK4P5_09870 [Fimbriimonadales bacterium]